MVAIAFVTGQIKGIEAELGVWTINVAAIGRRVFIDPHVFNRAITHLDVHLLVIRTVNIVDLNHDVSNDRNTACVGVDVVGSSLVNREFYEVGILCNRRDLNLAVTCPKSMVERC